MTKSSDDAGGAERGWRRRRGRVGGRHVKTFHMSWRKDEPRGYHHGNLREALIRAALELIAKKGAAGFTFAEAARFAGVSPAAPYRHFRDRDELMANVALRGFEQFEAALARAWDERPSRMLSPRSTGSARPISNSPATSPRITRRCSKPEFAVGANAELREASDRAFAVLRAAADKICPAMPVAARPPALMVALHIWTMAHGVASLFGRGDGGQRALPMTPAELLEAQVLVYLRGLGVSAAEVGPSSGASRHPHRATPRPARVRGAIPKRFERA